MTELYRAGPIKRDRRTNARLEILDQQIIAVQSLADLAGGAP
jgi:hypothetical protein